MESLAVDSRKAAAFSRTERRRVEGLSAEGSFDSGTDSSAADESLSSFSEHFK